MRAFDWASTPLGAVENWPQSLKTSVSICLASRFPIVLYWGPEYVVLYNDAYSQILGAKHPWALGKTCRECWAEIWDTIGPMLDGVLSTGNATWSDDLLLRLKRFGYAEECYFSFSFSPVQVETGVVGGVFTAVIETTEKVIGERRLRTLRELAARGALAKSESDAWRIAANTLSENDRDVPFAILCKVAGDALQIEGTAGITSSHRLCEELCRPGSELFQKAVQVSHAGQYAELREISWIPQDLPTGAWNESPRTAMLLPIAALGQGASGVLLAATSPAKALDEAYRTFFDILARQIATSVADARSYEEERKRAESLAALDRAKTLFFSNISHELRTPLTLLLGPTESALSSRDGALKGADLEMVHRNELRLLRLVNTLLDFSRIEAGRVNAVFEPTDVCTLTTDIASAFRSAMDKAGLRFSVDCEAIDEPLYVDREMWEKIVLNLLSNAFKFTFEGEVQLMLKRRGNGIELIVRDTGVGIPKDELPRIFERFHRIENVRARTNEGTGIGLALVQELVNLHGGSVHVESVPGKGSSFHITVPFGTAHVPADGMHTARTESSTALSAEAFVQEAERWVPEKQAEGSGAAIPGQANSAAPDSSDRRELIVVADDNADMRDYLAHLLREHYKVHAVCDGIEAIKAARQLKPTLILADIMMPGMDGFGVLREIRQDESLRSTPVILLSARAGEESRVEGLSAGADDYLVKPFTARELIARVATHVRMANLRRKAAESEVRLRAAAEQERQRLAELLAQAPAAIGLLNGHELRWSYVNQEYVRLTGRTSAAEFVGKTLLESLPELQRQVFVELLEEVYRTGRPYFGHEMKAVLNRSAKGLPEESYWDFVYQPVRDAAGNVEGILVHAVEVTERVLARRVVEESEKKYRDFAETASIALHWVGPDGTILWANRAELDMLGYTADEYIGHNITEFHVDSPVIDDILNRLCRGEKLKEYEARLRAKDGSIRHVVIDSSVLFENEKFIHTRCMTRDITERKQAQEALAESEERYRTVAETASDAIISIDEDSTILFANSATFQVFGYEPDEIVGRNLTLLMPDYMRELHKAGLQRYVASGKRHLNWDATELPGRHKDGREIPLEVSFGEYRKAGKHYFTGFARDITQRKVAERALRESEQKLRVVTEATPIMIWMSGTDKLCYYFNKSWLDFVGRSLEQEMGNGWAENVHPEDFDRCLKIYVSSFDARQPFEMEYRLRHHSGEYRWILDHGVPRYAADGTFEGYVGGCLDIHDQKEAAEKVRIASEALRVSEQRLRLAHQAAEVGAFEWDLRTNVNRWTPELEAMHGLAPGTFAGTQEDWERLIHPNDRSAALKQQEIAFATGAPVQAEWRVIWPDGSIHWILARWQVFKDESGTPARVAGINIDVTERKAAEEARRRLAAIVESSDDAIISKDLNGIITSWNRQAERLFGYTEAEMIGRSILTIIPPELQMDEDMILGKIRRGEKIDHFETIRVTKSGERIEVSLSISPVRDEAGRIVGAAKIARDIRESKKMERSLRTTEKLAAAGRLAATVAHEINNPLEAVTNLVYLAKRDLPQGADKLAGYLNSASRELDRVAHIARQTLGFYRDTSSPVRFNVAQVLDDLVGLYQRRLESRNIRLIQEYDESAELVALTGEIRQAFSNLISNSMDAMPSGGTLRIRVHKAHEWRGAYVDGVRITVADSGTGIRPEHKNNLFQPFFTTKEDIGTGLGLWITRSIVEKHGGAIRFKSKTGRNQGTTFSIFLPAQQQGASESLQSESTAINKVAAGLPLQ